MQGAASEAGPDTGLAMCCGQAGCWTDGDASEAARRVSDFLVGAPRVATRVSEIQYQCEGGPQRNRLVPSASSVSNEVKSLSVLKLCSTEGLCVEEKGGMHSLKEEFLEHAEQRSKEG